MADRQGVPQREDHLDQAALRAEVSSEALAKEEGSSLIGTVLSGLPAVASAKEGAVRRVVWDPWLTLVSHGDPMSRFEFCVWYVHGEPG